MIAALASRSRRVLFVFAWLVVGGEETEVRLLARHLNPARYRVEVVACFRKPNMPEQTHLQLAQLGVPVDRMPYGLSPEQTVEYLATKMAGYDLVVACQAVREVYPALERMPPQCRPPLIEHGGLVSEALAGPKHLTARYVGVCASIRDAAASLMPERPISEEQRLGAARKLTGKEEALLVATACSNPPEGRARWTLELLAGAMVRLTEPEELSRETVRRRLAENHLKPWRKDMWCIPQIDGTYVARMEDVLDLYAEPPDPKRPVVCFDESPTQLIGEARQPIPAAPGQLERYDYEYRRNGTVNLVVFLDAHRPWRRVKVTDQRTARDFAECMRELVDLHYPQAQQVRVVLDNLSRHSAGALYEAFPAPEAHRVLRRLEFHYTPKHASWLNMVEIEIGVLRGQCLDRRIGARDCLVSEIAA